MSDTVVSSPVPSARAEAAQVRAYYDEQIVNKVADFVDGNPRVDAAWRTIVAWAPPAPRHILDIGCGFGQISWQMAARGPHADVTGLDISPRSITLASAVFQSANLSYATRALDAIEHAEGYDLITLIDVYEHIAEADRPAFNASLARLMPADGVVVMTCPTPRYQQYLRSEHPDRLQPVDEDVDLAVLTDLARVTQSRLSFFQEHSIWMSGDYAHAVLTRGAALAPVRRPERDGSSALVDRVRRKWRAWRNGADRSRDSRLQMIERSLGTGVYRPR
jgi:cyclopropane fatty-acyl-phospholipid synthase-like methyltransferase